MINSISVHIYFQSYMFSILLAFLLLWQFLSFILTSLNCKRFRDVRFTHWLLSSQTNFTDWTTVSMGRRGKTFAATVRASVSHYVTVAYCILQQVCACIGCGTKWATTSADRASTSSNLSLSHSADCPQPRGWPTSGELTNQ